MIIVEVGWREELEPKWVGLTEFSSDSLFDCWSDAWLSVS